MTIPKALSALILNNISRAPKYGRHSLLLYNVSISLDAIFDRVIPLKFIEGYLGMQFIPNLDIFYTFSGALMLLYFKIIVYFKSLPKIEDISSVSKNKTL